MIRSIAFAMLAVAASAAIAAEPAARTNVGSAATAAEPGKDQRARESKWPTMTVHKSPTCPCCKVWVEHMRAHGFDVVVNDTYETDPIRRRLGVPAGKASCHTAEIDGLVIEGHVPARDVERLLAERGGAKGLVVPGMPIGSPGMESPDGRVQRYDVERIEADGTTTVFATHGSD
jgi:hypothetical protein